MWLQTEKEGPILGPSFTGADADGLAEGILVFVRVVPVIPVGRQILFLFRARVAEPLLQRVVTVGLLVEAHGVLVDRSATSAAAQLKGLAVVEHVATLAIV